LSYGRPPRTEVSDATRIADPATGAEIGTADADEEAPGGAVRAARETGVHRPTLTRKRLNRA